jgi:hypothetical protein
MASLREHVLLVHGRDGHDVQRQICFGEGAPAVVHVGSHAGAI